MIEKKWFNLFIVTFLLVTISGCINEIGTENQTDDSSINQQTDSIDNDATKADGIHGDEPLPPAKVDFFFSEDPILNKEVILTLKVTTNEIVEYAELQVNLPEGFELLSGEPNWEGALEPGTPQSVIVQVKAIKEGRWEPEGTIYGYFKYPEGISSGYNLYFTPHLYVYIKDDVAKVSDIPPTNNWRNIVSPSESQNDEGLSSALSLSEYPVQYKEVILTYVLNSSIQLDNAQISVVFPEKGMEVVNITSAVIEQADHASSINLSLIEGTQQYNWRGSIPEDSSVRIAMVVKTTLTGSGYVYSSVQTAGSNPISQTVLMSITVDEFSAIYRLG